MKKVILSTGLSLALLAGGALAAHAVGLPIANAATSTSTPVVTNTQTDLEQNDATEVQGTEANNAAEVPGTEENDATEVQGTDAKDTVDKEVNPADEQKLLQSLAKITAEQSKAAALLKVNGTVQSVALEDEDNKAVYNVVIKDNAGTIQEVKVDAQTGAVVKVDSPDANEQGEGSDTEQAD
jgi:uncharacterized membrane protein YkoI